MKFFTFNKIAKIALILAGIEILSFFLMIFFLMTDETVGAIGKTLVFIVKFVFGFPMVLVDSNLPFFLESKEFPTYMIPLAIINLIIQATLVTVIKKLITTIIRK